MRSLKGRLIVFMLQNRHLFRGQLKRESWDWNTSIPAFRELCEQTNDRMAALPPGISIEPVDVDGLNAEWVAPIDPVPGKVILYAIGGGYVSGSCRDHRAFVAKLAAGSRVTVLLVEHRLAPEHPYPAALEDELSAYRWLLRRGVAGRDLMIVGESAGGGLCLATLLALRDAGDPLPAGAVAISPWTDLKLTGESHRTRRKVCLSPPGMSEVCTRYYAGDQDRELPYMSPLYGDLHNLPPLLIIAGDWDTLIDDSTRFARKAKDAGVDVTLVVGEGMVHCYPLMAPLFPEASEGLDQVCTFIRAHLSQAAQPIGAP